MTQLELPMSTTTEPFYDVVEKRLATKEELFFAACYGWLNPTRFPQINAAAVATLRNDSASFASWDDTPVDTITALHYAARRQHLHIIPGVTVGLLSEQGLLSKGKTTGWLANAYALHYKNLHWLTADLRTNGHLYNRPSKVRSALLRAARLLPHNDTTVDANIRATLSAALEGGFTLPTKALAKLM